MTIDNPESPETLTRAGQSRHAGATPRILPWLAGLLVVTGCGEKKRLPEPRTVVVSADDGWQTREWPMARGGNSLQGRVHDRVPQHPVLEWSFSAKGAVSSEAAVGAGVIVYGNTEGMVIALDLQTRKERWRMETQDAVEATPAITGDRVFVGSNDGVYRALDLKSGREVWQIKGQDKFPTGGTLVNSPDGSEPWILVNGYDGVSHGLRTKDGSVVWQHASEDYINGSPVIINGSLAAFGGCDSVIHVIHLKDGTGSNKITTDAQIIRSLACRDSTLYGVNYANQLFATAAGADKLTWVYENDDAQFLTSPAVDDARVYVGSRDKHLHAVDCKSGKLLWKFKTGGRVESSPLVFDDAVVFGSNDGRLYALDKQDGREIWRLDLGENLAVAPAFAAGRIIIGGGEGTLFVIKEGNK